MALALTPVPAALAALAVYLLPERASRLRPAAGWTGLGLTLVLLLLDAGAVAGGSRLQVALGDQVVAAQLLLRADPTAMVLAITALAAGCLAALDHRVTGPRLAALLTCVTGSVIAALADDAISLFAGVEIASLGTFLLLRAPGRRAGRAALAALAVEHAGALGLLSAAVQLQVSYGSSAFAGLPAGAISAAVAWPWAAAAALRLLTPALQPVKGAALPAAVWASAATVPCAAAMLLRLRGAATGGSFPPSVQILMAVLGALAAIAAAWWALHPRTSSAAIGRALCLLAAAPVVALAGFPAATGLTVAAGLGALELCAALTGAWEAAAWRGKRLLAPAAALAAGGLPLGFGTTAAVLELGDVAGLGRGGIPLLLALLAGMVAAAVIAARLASRLFREAEPPPVPGAGRPGRYAAPPPLALAALAVSALAALFPGGALGWVLTLLGGGSARPAGAAAVLGRGGGWAGGYFVVAAAFLAVGTAAALRLTGVSVRVSPRPVAESPRQWEAGHLLWRLLRLGLHPAAVVAGRVDAWLVLQPQLPLLVGSALLASLLLR